MFCSYCGASNVQDARFCSSCGRSLAVTPASAGGSDLSASQVQAAERHAGYTALTEMGLPIDTVLAGRYRIRRELGTGGMGRVYLAEDETLGTLVAIKVLRNLLSHDPGSVQRLKKEAKLAMQLSHTNIVRVHNYHESELIKFLVMEYVEGETLAYRLAREDSLQEAEACRIAVAICHGLEHAHEKRIIHRDLKPGNILLGQDGSIKIADFGIARVCRDSMSRLTSQLDSGTLIYMSPEQLMGESSELSDLYSMGVILYELLSGEVPFHSGDIQAQIREKPPKPLPNVSGEMNHIVLKCLVKMPQGRLASVGELRALLLAEIGRGQAGPRVAGLGTEALGPPSPPPLTDAVPREQPPTAGRQIRPPLAAADTARQSPPSVPSAAQGPQSPITGTPAAETRGGMEPSAGPERSIQSHLRGGQVLTSAVRGAIGFGLGAVPPAICWVLYVYRTVTISGILALLALMSYVCWGWIGARILKVDRTYLRRFLIAFLVPGALFAAASISDRNDELVFVALLVGLLIAGSLSGAAVRRNWRLVAAGSLAFGLLPFFFLALYDVCLKVLDLQQFSAFAAPMMAAALSGFLFGSALALWGNPRTTATASGEQRDR